MENSSPKNQITFVCCIEYGRLEHQTILLAETFRANAGEFSSCRIIAVVGRYGAKLSKDTVNRLSALNVELIYATQYNQIPWFNYSNKFVAIKVAQETAITPQIAWLDSDMLVARPLHGLLLSDTEDFAATFEYLPPAMVEGERLQEPYWQSLFKLFKVDFDEMPLVENEMNLGKSQSLYFTSGVFVWRRNTNFAKAFYDGFHQLMESRIAQYDGMFYNADQVLLTPLVLKEKLRWRHLDYPNHHVTIPGQIEGVSASPKMNNSSILHYSHSMHAEHRPKYMNRLAKECPHLIKFIQENDQLKLSNSLSSSWLATWLKFYRGLKWKLYAKGMKITEKGASV